MGGWSVGWDLERGGRRERLRLLKGSSARDILQRFCGAAVRWKACYCRRGGFTGGVGNNEGGMISCCSCERGAKVMRSNRLFYPFYHR